MAAEYDLNKDDASGRANVEGRKCEALTLPREQQATNQCWRGRERERSTATGYAVPDGQPWEPMHK
jgi:hypothetical protein